MFTLKYRMHEVTNEQLPADCEAPKYASLPIEQIHGPFDEVSQSWQDRRMVVHANRHDGEPGMTFGPIITVADEPAFYVPRPTLWVMNESGATVATYHL